MLPAINVGSDLLRLPPRSSIGSLVGALRLARSVWVLAVLGERADELWELATAHHQQRDDEDDYDLSSQ